MTLKAESYLSSGVGHAELLADGQRRPQLDLAVTQD
jgi:hypothetical protein